MNDINELVTAIPTTVTVSVEYVGPETSVQLLSDANELLSTVSVNPGSYLLYMCTTDKELYQSMWLKDFGLDTNRLNYQHRSLISQHPHFPQLAMADGVRGIQLSSGETNVMSGFESVADTATDLLDSYERKMYDIIDSASKSRFGFTRANPKTITRLRTYCMSDNRYDIIPNLDSVLFSKLGSYKE